MVKKKIHINQHNIKHNAKNDQKKPVISVKTYKSNDYGYEVELTGESKVIYRPDKPLSCGAKVWIETHKPVIIDGEKKV
jgi:hypothetical protein